jgi:COMM domain containing 10
MALFVQTKRLNDAVSLMNTLEERKFPLLLQRIVSKLHQRGTSFSDKEQEKLAKMLKLNQGELSTILEACSYVFEKALYEGAKTSKLQQSLETVGLEPPGVAAFCATWKEHSKQAVANAKENTIAGPRMLTSFAWRTDMHLAQSSTAKLKEQSAIFDFTTNGTDGKGEEQFAVELSHEELYDFFLSLERIQSQLDSLGK